MKKNYRSSVAAVAASLAMVAFASGQAFGASVGVPQYLANDSVKTLPSSALNMGGSSFDANLVGAAYAQWTGLSSNNANALTAYQSHSSGTGRANLLNGTYNIGFSDVPLNAAGQDTTDTTAYAQIPVALGGVAIVYNINFPSSVSVSAVFPATGTAVSTNDTCNSLLMNNPLNLTPSLVANIFAGNITSWDNAAIIAANPKLTISVGYPMVAAHGSTAQKNGMEKVNCLSFATTKHINVISRTSGSGTTFIFQDYLNSVSAANFPYPTSAAFTAAGAQVANSTAMATAVNGGDGDIGYVESGYAVQNNEPAATINKIAPTFAQVTNDATQGLKNILASGCNGFSTNQPTTYAAANVNTNCFTIVNSGKGYPISGFSYAIVAKHQSDLATAETIVKFLLFLSQTPGQSLANGTYYAALPANLQSVAYNALLGVSYQRNGAWVQALSTSL